MKLTRRDTLKLMAAGGLALGAPSLLAPSLAFAETALDVPSLRDAAAARGLKFGSEAATIGIQHGGKAFSDMLERHCALYCPVFSWKWIDAGGPGKYDWSEKKPGIDSALAHGLKLSGYHLVWHEAIPQWMVDTKDRTKAEAYLRGHIAYMAKTFGPNTYSWNVINEALYTWDNRPDYMRNSSYYFQTFGTDYFRIAFEEAKRQAPQIPRLYNDYGFESDKDTLSKRKGLLYLLDFFIKEKLPIDGVGLQAHLNLPFDSFDEKAYREFLKEIAARGFKIYITELDVTDTALPGSIAERDKAVADAYKRLLDVALDEKAVKSVVVWGLDDGVAWINEPKREQRFIRADGQLNRPALFDAQYQPKPSYYAVLNALRHAPVRT